MTQEVIETAIQEIMEEQKANRKLSERLTGKIDHLSELIESLKEQQNDRKTNMEPQRTDVLPGVETGLEDIKQLLKSQSKNVVHEKRFLFFPEHYAKEYYSIILRWILYIIIASYSYSILKHIIDHWSR
jgi:hypothetical protein